ncbi:DUF4262 domain-containing protein, partial [Streptomyces kebangsaanensis]
FTARSGTGAAPRSARPGRPVCWSARRLTGKAGGVHGSGRFGRCGLVSSLIDLGRRGDGRGRSWCRDFFGAGVDYCRAPPLPVMQLFWPDEEGRFPWGDRAEECCRASRPLLWGPKEETRGPWADLDRDRRPVSDGAAWW